MFAPFAVRLGRRQDAPSLAIAVLDYQHPDTAEPADLDLLSCRADARAGAVEASFDVAIGLWELLELREYLGSINSGNGPARSFALGGGLLTLSFAPSRRGPVLCSVLLKSIDASHLRLEYLVTLEPEAISRTLEEFAALDRGR